MSTNNHQHRHGFTNKEEQVIAFVRSFTSSQLLAQGLAQVVGDEIGYGPWIGPRLARYQYAFPQCELFSWLALWKYFYIRRYNHRHTSGNRVVHYVASPNRQAPGFVVGTDASLNRWLRISPWFARATCRNGEITHVETATRFQTGIDTSVKRCGFASILIYLCLVNNQHIAPGGVGYPGLHHPTFQQGNMPQIVGDLIEPHCRRIIYVHYQRRRSPSQFLAFPQENEDMTGVIDGGTRYGPHKGNKAFIYAAQAARYGFLITFNPNPCQEGCCRFRSNKNHALVNGQWVETGTGEVIPAETTDNPNAKVFRIRDILSDFNKHEPASINISPQLYSINPPMLWQTKSFVRHNGRHWFFCSEQDHEYDN